MYIFNDYLFIAALVLMLISIVLHYYSQYKCSLSLSLSLSALFFAALFIRYFAAHLDPFLHDWDEKFHALVALNMMEDPLTPMLRTKEVPMYDFNYTAWCCNHIWLHKQPMFMWQMALSMKIFGVTEFAIRYPSVLMGAIMVLFVYRIAVLLTKEKTLAFGAAMLMCVSHYQLELISGYYGMDHNDLAFGFYVLASIWAYTEYINNTKAGWAVLIGVFAGCAILNKWLTGLLVYSAWGLTIVFSLLNKTTKNNILHFLVSLIVCVIFFLPWQLYILDTFPKEAMYEYALNSMHIFDAVENHGGDILFYLGKFYLYYGNYVYWLLPVGIIFLLVDKGYDTKIKQALIVYFLLVFVFFSFVVQTKMTSFLFPVVPLGFIFIAVALFRLTGYTKLPKLTYILLMLIGCYFVLDVKTIGVNHHPKQELRMAKMKNAAIYKNIRAYLPEDVKIVINMPRYGDVELMFYHPDIIAYTYAPSKEIFDMLEKSKTPVAAFNNHKDYYLPDYARWYTYRYIIHKDFGYVYFAD